MKSLRKNSSNLTHDYFAKIMRLVYFMGAPNYWFEDFDVSKTTMLIHDFLSKLITSLVFVLILSEWSALYTQHNLNDKQKSDSKLFCCAHPILYGFVLILEYHKEKLRYIVKNLAQTLKEVYNDKDIGKQMTRKSDLYITAFTFFLSIAVFLYGVDGAVQVFTKDEAFTTIITAWPDVDDRSKLAGYARVIAYIGLCFYLVRIASAFMVVITVTIGLSHQFKNLQCYFKSLNDIFEKKDVTQEDKEKQYEDAFKVGINMHSKTLWCTKLCEEIFHGIYFGEIVVNCVVLVLLMSQMLVSERTLSNTLTTVMTAICVLTNTGCLMWNAGDVTIEASKLPIAMYLSGWHHCKGQSSKRIKPLLVIAIARSQDPVVLRCFGVIELSYATFLSIVKSTYSVFSVLY